MRCAMLPRRDGRPGRPRRAAPAHAAARAVAARGRRASSRASASRGEAHGVHRARRRPAHRASSRRRSRRARRCACKIAEVTPEQVTLRLDPRGRRAAAAAAGPRAARRWPSRSRRGRGAAAARRARRRVAVFDSARARPARPADRPRARDRERDRRRRPPGRRWSCAEAAAGRCEDALAEKTGRAATVRVAPAPRPVRRLCLSAATARRGAALRGRRRPEGRRDGPGRTWQSGSWPPRTRRACPVREDPSWPTALGGAGARAGGAGGAVAGRRGGARVGLRARKGGRLPRIGDVGVWTLGRYPLRPPL